MSDILLTHGYFLYNDPAEREVMRPYPPLGLLYISAYLKERGFDVAVADNTFSDWDTFAATLKQSRPAVLGIYVNMMTRRNALKALRLAKDLGSTVVLGGPEPVNYADEYLERGADIIVAGEGERTLEELIPHLARHGLSGLDQIDGLIFANDDGTVHRTAARAQLKPLDDLPFPDREAIDIPAYMDVWKRHHGASSVSLITARGCPYTCRWCSHSVFGHTHRRRSVENVADELELIREQYTPDQVWYADDVFTINKKWIARFAGELKRRGLHFPFETISREDRLDEQTIDHLADLGCTRLWVGAESGSQRVLDAMDRKTDAARMREMIARLRKAGIRTGTFLMLGYHGEEWRDIDETVRHLKASLPDDVLTTLAYPIKGTPYFDEVAEDVLALADWEQGSDRDYTVRGRFSRRFYRLAEQWMINEVRLAKQTIRGPRDVLKLAKTFAMAKANRIGMYALRGELEHG